MVSLLILNRSQIGSAWVFYFSVVNNKATVLIHLEVKEGWGGMEGMVLRPRMGKTERKRLFGMGEHPISCVGMGSASLGMGRCEGLELKWGMAEGWAGAAPRLGAAVGTGIRPSHDFGVKSALLVVVAFGAVPSPRARKQFLGTRCLPKA